MDFQNLEKELTPQELAIHRAAEIVEPHGDARADLRNANTTLHLIQALSSSQLTNEQISNVLKHLTTYWQTNDAKETTAEEAARQGKAAFAKLGL